MDPGPLPQRAVAHIAASSAGKPLDSSLRVTVNFHPDRVTAGGPPGVPILESMRQTQVYLSQFATGTSNGGLTAQPGGDRWRWESQMFGGLYDEASPHQRPVYRALNHRNAPAGGSPRFGSAHLRLSGEVLTRTTFCYPDSCFEPTAVAVTDRFALLDLLETDHPDDVLAALTPDDAAGRIPERDPLDGYVEAQVHGRVRFDRDVEALVLDPSHRGTEVEARARLLPCPVEWHHGFRLTVEVLRRNADYRGQQYVDLGLHRARLAGSDVLTPRILGEAARSGCHDPQALKRLWHYLARFGYAQRGS